MESGYRVPGPGTYVRTYIRGGAGARAGEYDIEYRGFIPGAHGVAIATVCAIVYYSIERL